MGKQEDQIDRMEINLSLKIDSSTYENEETYLENETKVTTNTQVDGAQQEESQEQYDDKQKELEAAEGTAGEIEDEATQGDEASQPSMKKEELSSLQTEMDRMKEENKLLRKVVEETMKDYSDLQMKFAALRQSNQHEDPQVSLSLQSNTHNPIEGPSRTLKVLEAKNQQAASSSNDDTSISEDELGLSLLLQTSQHEKEEDKEETKQESGSFPSVPNNKKQRIDLPGGITTQLASPPNRKARVSVRARCETATMNDGCQWRKYGQKIAKGNPCPRAYYRCTVAAGCPVRKQVQRCLEDMSILITTYEGTHNHPLPVGATAMASTASAAASFMLLDSSNPDAVGTSNFTQVSLPYQNFHSIYPTSNNLSNLRSLNPMDPSKGIVLDLTNNLIDPALKFPKNPIATSSTSASQLGFSWMPNKSSYQSGSISMAPNIFSSPRAGMDNEDGKAEDSSKPLADNVSVIASDPKFRVAVAAAITSLINTNKENGVNHPIRTSSLGSRDGEAGGSSSSNNWVLESLSANGKAL